MVLRRSTPHGAETFSRQHDPDLVARFSAAEVCGFVQYMVANGFGIDRSDMLASSRRQAPVAFARQAAMYLAHVACGYNLTDVGRCFARDRTTVAHACERVEDRRDAPSVDLALDYLEVALSAWLAATGARPAPNREQTASGREG